MVLENTLNFLFKWILRIDSPWDLIIISFIITFFVNLAMKFLSNQKEMKSLKEESSFYREEMKKFRNDPQKLMEIQKKSMESSLKYMRHSMKPMLFTLLPLLIIFNWLRNTFQQGETLINFPFSIPLIGSGLGWLGTYIISSIIFSLILKKILKLH